MKDPWIISFPRLSRKKADNYFIGVIAGAARTSYDIERAIPFESKADAERQREEMSKEAYYIHKPMVVRKSQAILKALMKRP